MFKYNNHWKVAVGREYFQYYIKASATVGFLFENLKKFPSFIKNSYKSFNCTNFRIQYGTHTYLKTLTGLKNTKMCS